MPELDNNIAQTEGELEALQVAVVELLRRHPALAAAQILHEDQGDIENEIEQAISEQGLTLLVLSPSGRSDSPDADNLIIDDLEIAVRVIEVPIINRGDGGTKIPINRAVQMVATWLRNQIISGQSLVFSRFEPDQNADVPTKDVIFTTTLVLTAI